MSAGEAALLFVAALAAGGLNSIAGGGSFIAFPALLFTGMLPINANATSTMALWPGNVASAVAYRRELRVSQSRVTRVLLLVVSVIGGVAGARLLLRTPQATFMRMVPWLLGIATFLFAIGGPATQWIRRLAAKHHPGSNAGAVLLIFLQLLVAVYIGYFGAGAGILMLALFAIMGMENIHSMNALKTLLGSAANSIAIVVFVLAGSIYWPQALVMVFGAALGGYGGAWYAQKLNPVLVRYSVIILGAGMSFYFFWKVYG